MENLAEAIRHIAFFSELSREDLARIVGKLEEESFSAGQIIVKQGEVGDALHLLRSGAVEVVLEHEGRRVESVAILGPYECFGEMALFTGQKRSASVIALIDSVVLKLRKETWEELLAQHPSLSLHFCKILSQRLAETNQDISKGRGAFQLALEEFFSRQPAAIQDFLLCTSILKTLDPGAIQSVLSQSDTEQLLASLSSKHPVFLRATKGGGYEYLDYFRDYLYGKLEQRGGRRERDELHLRFASYFSGHAQWAAAVHHYIQAEAWKEAIEHLEAQGNMLSESERPKDILQWLDALPLQLARTHGLLTRLRAEAHVRLGDLDAAIRSYREFLVAKQVSAAETLETARYYQELAELHRKKGEVGEALGCLRLGLTILEQGRVNTNVVQAIHSIEALQQMRGLHEAALQWADRAFSVAHKLAAKPTPKFLPYNRKWLGWFLALAIGGGIWAMPPPIPLDERGIRFLATLAAGVILWLFNVVDDYIVAIMLLLVWLLFGLAPPEMAVAGFSKSSWFFVLGVLGIGAAVTKSGLLYRVALQVLRQIPPNYKVYSFVLAASGLLVTPLLPDSQGRLAIVAPISRVISESLGLKALSNGSAGLVLSAYIGFSQAAFVFLTGSTVALIGWNLLPEPARQEFGWGRWTLAALPAGIFLLAFLFLAIHLLFPQQEEERSVISPRTLESQLEILGPLTRSEWLSVAILALAVTGWLGKSLHGIGEAWVALGALMVFSLTEVMDKKAFRENIDWGYLLFVGVISSLVVIIPYLQVDRWLMQLVHPMLSPFSFNPLSFLIAVILLVDLARLLLSKSTTVILFILGLTSWAMDLGIHPGILLLTILMGIEAWFLPYQTDSYQIAYYSTDEKGFSHAQARKLMVAKFIASLLALAISVPYWKMLGFIR